MELFLEGDNGIVRVFLGGVFIFCIEIYIKVFIGEII